MRYVPPRLLELLAVGLSWPLGTYLTWAMEPTDAGRLREGWEDVGRRRLGRIALESQHGAASTTATSNGSVNPMHDSLNPLTGLCALAGMWLNVVFGGVGVGMINMFLFIVLAVFLAGMMVGRTPEYLTRKIETQEVRLAILALVLHPLFMQQVRQWSGLPIIVLSARGEEKSKIMALDAGADDYVTKPFGIGELLARRGVALRHANRRETGAGATTACQFGRVHGDLAERRVFVGDLEVKLTKIEFDLLALLVRNAGKVLTHRFLLKSVWGPDAVNEPHYVRVFMANLRQKLERNPSRPEYLLTEQGVGHRLKSD